LVIRYVEHFDASGESVLENARKMSLEGIVSKQLDYIYRPPTNAAAIVADIGSMS
jgi:bifunctional non-homologous end joining protein LigD